MGIRVSKPQQLLQVGAQTHLYITRTVTHTVTESIAHTHTLVVKVEAIEKWLHSTSFPSRLKSSRSRRRDHTKCGGQLRRPRDCTDGEGGREGEGGGEETAYHKRTCTGTLIVYMYIYMCKSYMCHASQFFGHDAYIQCSLQNLHILSAICSARTSMQYSSSSLSSSSL